jgi:hypothetical protein
MGIARPKDLSDLIKFEAHLRVTCSKCGRSGVFPVKDVLVYFRSKGWNTAWEVAGSHFVCRGMDPDDGCGERAARLGLEPIPQPMIVPKPEPTKVEIKREIRRRRG